MKADIYKALRSNGFSSKNQDKVNNKRLGIARTFTDENDRYVEVYPERWGYSVLIYGPGFMSGVYPYRCDVLSTKDINQLAEKINHIVGDNNMVNYGSDAEKIVWTTLESYDQTNVLKQHGFISYKRGAFYEYEYDGNISLCRQIAAGDGDKYSSIADLKNEKLDKRKACKNCLKIYKNQKLDEQF